MSLETLNTYSVKRGFECFNACIVNSFAKAGVDISSSDVFFSTDTNILTQNEQSIMEVPSSVLFLEKYNILYENDFCANADIYTLWKNGVLNAESSLVVRVRPEIMNYSKRFSSNMGSGHYINVISVDEKQVCFCDGYVSKITDSVYSGAIDKGVLLEAWNAERNKYRILHVPTDMDVEQVKENAKGNLLSYVNYSHELLESPCVENPKHPVLKMLWDLCERMQKGENFDSSFISFFFYAQRVHGFLIVQNMIWEKLMELSFEFAEEYGRIITKWNQTLMFMRKYMLQAKTDKLTALYISIIELIKEEDEILTRALLNNHSLKRP